MLFCLLHIFIFIRVFSSGSPDVELYCQYADYIGRGQVPYLDFNFEYPPGAILVFLLPGLITEGIKAYSLAFTVEMLIFDLAGLLLAAFLGRRWRYPVWVVLLIYTLALISVGTILVQRFDLVPAVVTLASLFCFYRGNYKAAWSCLAVGVLIKLYPLVLAPLFLIWQIKLQGWRNAVVSLTAFVLVIALVAVPFLCIDPGGFKESFQLQGDRALQIESSYASILMLASELGLGNASVYLGDMSFDLASPFSEFLASYAVVFMIIGLLLVYMSFYRRFGSDPGNKDTALAEILNYSLLAILVVLLASKVLSPQFMIWLLPLVPLVGGKMRYYICLVFLGAACLTVYLYPAHYYELVSMESIAVAMLVLRNLLLAIMALMVAFQPRYAAEATKQ